jgi:hypothetical protein
VYYSKVERWKKGSPKPEKWPQWLKDADILWCDVEVSPSGYVTWYEGLWVNGVWADGSWYSGTWQGGVWEGGLWQGGLWKGGACSPRWARLPLYDSIVGEILLDCTRRTREEWVAYFREYPEDRELRLAFDMMCVWLDHEYPPPKPTGKTVYDHILGED